MATITKSQIIDAIRDELDETGVFARTQGSEDLSEGMNDTPTLQVYWESTDNDAATANDRTTFRGGVRQKHFVFHCDIYARQRSHLDQDNKAVLDLSDAVEAKLETQNSPPFFELEGIKAFKWRGDRVSFEYENGVKYAGCRYTMEVWVY